MAAAVSIHDGIRLLGVLPLVRMKTAFLDFEPFGAGEHKRRMRHVCGVDDDFPNQDLPDLLYVDCYGSTLVEQVERIQRVVRDEKIEFLVLDSIGFAADGPLTARSFWHAVGQIGRPVLATGHTPKSGDEVFGSRFWRAGARLAWHITKFDTEKLGMVALRFVNQKVSIERNIAPVGLTFDFSQPRRLQITMTAAKELAAPQGEFLHAKIAAVLHRIEHGWATFPELALQAGAEYATVKRAVHEHPKLFVILDALPGGRHKRVALRARQEQP